MSLTTNRQSTPTVSLLRSAEPGLDDVLQHMLVLGTLPAHVARVGDLARDLAASGDGGFELDDWKKQVVTDGMPQEVAAILEMAAKNASLGAATGIAPGAFALAKRWERTGRKFGGQGYDEARWISIAAEITGHASRTYGAEAGGIDERAVEYPWVFDRLRDVHAKGEPALDAGSTLNHPLPLMTWIGEEMGPLSIYTLRHEGFAHVSDMTRYEFGDLRAIPYRDAHFATVVSLSTLEHVGMDNSVYGDGSKRAPDPRAEMRRAITEIARVLRSDGRFLMSVPVGAEDDRGWFRILTTDELADLGRDSLWAGMSMRTFRAREHGWEETDRVADAGYNEPEGRGRRTAPTFVAAAEAVALLEFVRR